MKLPRLTPVAVAAGAGALIVIVALSVWLTGSEAGTDTPRSDAGHRVALGRCNALDMSDQLECYSDYLDTVRHQWGATTALEVIGTWHTSGEAPAFTGLCHEVHHRLGGAEMSDRLDAGDPELVFSAANLACTGGYVHGALDTYFESVDPERLDLNAPRVCAEFLAQAPTDRRDDELGGWLRWQCDHMIGHALYRNHLDDPVVGAGVCATITGKPPDGSGDDDRASQRTHCGAGFFMEHFLTVLRNPGASAHTMTPQRPDDAVELCLNVHPEVGLRCWSEAGMVLHQVSDGDWERAATACWELTEGEQARVRTACFEGLGRALAPLTGFDPGAMELGCQSVGRAGPGAADACFEELAVMYIAEFNDRERADDACSEVEHQPARTSCRDRVQRALDDLSSAGLAGDVGVGSWT
jgi:hypothetical protein